MSTKRTILLVLVVLGALTSVTLVLGSVTAGAASALTCAVPSAAYPTIQSAVDDAACDVVRVGAGTFYENVTVTRTVRIIGQGATRTTVDGIASGSVFAIGPGAAGQPDVILAGLRISNGSSDRGGGVTAIDASVTISHSVVSNNWARALGGGVYASADNGTLAMTVTNSMISANEADTGGGLYLHIGSMVMADTIVSDNDADFHGGGIFNGNGDMRLTAVWVRGNTTHVDGGGLFNHGVLTVYGSAFNGNTSTNYSGGGVRNEGTAYISNSTISGNRAVVDEAGIDNESGTLRLSSSTVANNDGGGIGSRGSNVRVRNSIVAGNWPGDCRGTVHSDGYNLVENVSNCDYRAGTGDLVGAAPWLGPLEGSPAYHPLLIGPGIDGGNPAGCTDHLGQPLDRDQRGLPRVGRCDIGAYEFQGQISHSYFPAIAVVQCADFFDDFSDPASGWPVGEDDYVKYHYLDGEYRVRTKRDGYFYLFDAPACNGVNYVVETDARWEGSPANSYGIVFGVVGDFERFYLFDVNTDYRMYRLFYLDASGWTTLIPPTSANAIAGGGASNHLKVTRNGTAITLEVNGTTLQTLHDGRIGGRTFTGVIASPYNGEPVSDARFDNFAVTYLPSPSGSSGNAPDSAAPVALPAPLPEDVADWTLPSDGG